MNTVNRNEPCPCGSGRKYKKCCLAQGVDPAEAAYNLGVTAFGTGHLDEAVACFRRALALRPGFAEAHNNLGLTFLSQDRLEASAQAFRAALAARPDYGHALFNLAGVALRLGDLPAAIDAYQRVVTLSPADADARHQLGKALLRSGRVDEAAACFEQALALRPGVADTLVNLANARINQGRHEDAVRACEQAIALKADSAEAELTRAIACYKLGRLDESTRACERAIALRPGYAEAYVNLANGYNRPGGLDQAVAALRRALELDPDFAAAHSALLVTLQYMGEVTPAQSFAEHRRFAARFEAPLKSGWRPHPNARDPERRLKIGYLSPDFRRHSVAWFIEPVFAAHDKSAVEVYGYYNHHRQDDMSARLAAAADHWLPCWNIGDAQLAARIRADGIDILVDLAGHTNENRLLTLARKPAPVQVTWLGYPATTGLDAVDYRLCTRDTDPPGQERWHSETLYRLPRSLWCYRPPAERPAIPSAPRAHRVDAVTFGSMNNPAKITLERLDLWAEILLAVPGSRLVMTNIPAGPVCADIRARFTRRGIAPERLRFPGRLPASDYCALLDRIDIALDPFPYNGTTTTCETLWAGIPVVTQAGEGSAARAGHALLRAVGLEALVTASEVEYVRAAVELAHDPARLSALHAELPARFAASPLRDEAGFTRDLEAAYRDMWRRWCRADTEKT
ncbi:MAG: tetratricopeptide repeat protein [Gammaproteobacteria bacterium]|nr:tetratricopeptide repeat protein [Gammaproteobacteria bacterium]